MILKLNQNNNAEDIVRNSFLQHIAIIMDGNRRWAAKNKLPIIEGHRRGLGVAKEIIRDCANLGVNYLTLFGFSTENWQRPPAQVSAMLNLLRNAIVNELHIAHEVNARVKFIGDLSRFSEDFQQNLRHVETTTQNNSRITVMIALNYGGKWDIVNAAKALCEKVQKQEILPSEINEDIFSQYISTGAVPEPDLLIRTSGEERISNFLLWQLAYTELYFCDKFWPEFTPYDLRVAINDYSRRVRTKGSGIVEQQVHHS